MTHRKQLLKLIRKLIKENYEARIVTLNNCDFGDEITLRGTTLFLNKKIKNAPSKKIANLNLDKNLTIKIYKDTNYFIIQSGWTFALFEMLKPYNLQLDNHILNYN